jgi:hypothetical protein
VTNFYGDAEIFFFFFEKKKLKMADSKKGPFFKIANSQYFFVKIYWIGPWEITPPKHFSRQCIFSSWFLCLVTLFVS